MTAAEIDDKVAEIAADYRAQIGAAGVGAAHTFLAAGEFQRGRQGGLDEGYVRGLRAAVRWLDMFDQDLPDFDRATCVQLAKGMRAMWESATRRLGVDIPDESPMPGSVDELSAAAGLRAACRAAEQ